MVGGPPTLMVTAFGDEQLATRALHAGALDYVVKDPALAFLAELPKRVGESVTRHSLKQLNRLLSAALESARDGVMITDRGHVIQHVNRALEEMTGFTRACGRFHRIRFTLSRGPGSRVPAGKGRTNDRTHPRIPQDPSE